jgi:hypothetical protein
MRKVDPHGSVSFAGTGYRVAIVIADRPSASASSATPFRSPSTGRLCERIGPATIDPRSSQLWPSPTANPGGVVMVSHSYRSQSGTRVVNLDKDQQNSRSRRLL